MFTTELITLLSGSAVGFLFRFLAQKSADQKELFNQAISLNKLTTENQNEAVKRVPTDVGAGVRRLIVLSILFATLLAPFILPFFGVPTFVEVDANNPEALFGIFPAFTKKYFIEINGFLYTSENRQILVSIIGFYFGSAAASNKS